MKLKLSHLLLLIFIFVAFPIYTQARSCLIKVKQVDFNPQDTLRIYDAKDVLLTESTQTHLSLLYDYGNDIFPEVFFTYASSGRPRYIPLLEDTLEIIIHKNDLGYIQFINSPANEEDSKIKSKARELSDMYMDVYYKILENKDDTISVKKLEKRFRHLLDSSDMVKANAYLHARHKLISLYYLRDEIISKLIPKDTLVLYLNALELPIEFEYNKQKWIRSVLAKPTLAIGDRITHFTVNKGSDTIIIPQDKCVLLFLSSFNCGYCMKQLDQIAKDSLAYDKSQIIAVNASDNFADYREGLASKPFPYTDVYDPDLYESDISYWLWNSGTPYGILIEDGVFVKSNIHYPEFRRQCAPD